jgi:protein phosphatase
MLKLIGAARSNVGLKRTNNEDSFFFDSELGLFLVADGMGGAACGELASRLVAETIADYYKHYFNEDIESVDRFDFYDRRLSNKANTLMQAVYMANKLVFDAARQNKDYGGMGSTLAALLVDEDRIFIVHVGDSRIYRARTNQFVRLTVDHRLTDDPKMRAMIDPEATLFNDMDNVLTRAMGVRENVDPDLRLLSLDEGDIFLLCSDGLSDMVEEDMIAEVLSLDRSLDQKAQDLIELALAGGGRDNVTVVLALAEPLSRLKGLLNKITKGN